ncbi:cathepsin O [Elysia marginata]|uniref:Cathepsin O n=1 Tax=Elysia marginata TaxID=1093978 RepID=A0AAV4FBA8_9GAST|nr:cathepsin O [Elysia marginata]
MQPRIKTCTCFLIAIFTLICLIASPGAASPTYGFDLKLNPLRLEDDVLFIQFYDFATKHGRQYISNSSELLFRFQVYKDSAKKADRLNRPYKTNNKSGPVFGVNKFSDLTPEEFRAKYLSGLKHPRTTLKFGNSFFKVGSLQSPVNMKALPDSVDWRDKSVLSPVIDQKGCGACWAISTVETMEAMSVIENRTKSVNRLSIQEVIDCDDENKGCEGGDICQAAKWASSHGIVPEKDYPLTRKTGTCKKVSELAEKVKVSGYSCNNFVGNENKILEILANHGPVTVAVDAATWHNYVGGIIRFHCSAAINHAVQIVGYNLKGEVPYYIIRNSWGPDFGDKGYLYVRIGKNLCGVANEVVTLSVSPPV